MPSIVKGVRRILRLLARPVYRSGRTRGIVIQPFRGFGSSERVFCTGRVIRQPRAAANGDRGVLRDVFDVIRRLLRRGVPEALVEARIGDCRGTFRTDSRGFLTIDLGLDRPLDRDKAWHGIDLRLLEPQEGEEARGLFFVPPDSARFAVISDIDDTIMFTGVANKLKMFWRLFMRSAESRVAFPGVAALYRGLHEGTSHDRNPMLYVSRGPWTVYEMLEAFFVHHRIPEVPVLFLRDWGVSPTRPLGYSGEGHKEALIRRMLEVYPDLPFVLVGDSGQRDPEIYADMVREHRGRILAVYIRDVSDSGRRADIQRLARAVEAVGSTLVLSADSFDMAEHAAELGLITTEALRCVLEEREEEEMLEEA